VTAFETVAFDSARSPAAAANDRSSTTFAKIARPSKSGSFAMLAILLDQNEKQCVSFVSISKPIKAPYQKPIGFEAKE
jgi:hypothetical protein